mgnify:FL=1|jgi:hypothetical protein|tara:strand:+ start:645 stop:1121 length:477 start_codon:yes stop_codon:yes gene_type:complete
MSIKNVKPSSKSKFRQGYYKPKFPQKYRGGDPIIYRSSWERKFCHWCDHNEDVIYWISEPFSIPYFNLLDNKWHKYYPDFFFKMKTGDTAQEYVVEIKPKAQLQKPKEPKRKTAKALKNFKYAYESYVRNLCKTNALNKMAKERNCKVMLLTEDSNLF